MAESLCTQGNSRFSCRFVCGEDGTFLDCNDQMLQTLHLDSAEAARKSNFFAYFPTGKSTKKFIADLRSGIPLEKVELCLCPPGHDPIWVCLCGTVHHAPSGQFIGFEAEMIDITREYELREQLMRAQKLSALGQLTGGIAHDFNNLLSIITGYSDLLLEELERDARLQPLLVEVSRAADRGARMTRQLLAFSRKRPTTLTVVDVRDTLIGLEKMLRRLIGEQISLELTCEEVVPPVRADVGQLEQILMNLVVNARDAIAEQGCIFVRCQVQQITDHQAGIPDKVPPGNYVVIAVEDNGHGIDSQHLARIFEPFFTTKQEQRGTGLGLATSRSIMERFNGHIQVTSQPDVGTTFRLFLPEAAGQVRTLALERPQLSTMRGTETILVVEDDELVRDVIVRVLSVNGYRVLQAADAKSAKLLLASNERKIDLLLIDVVLPDIMGPDLAASITKDSPDILILFMSGYADRAAEKYGLIKDHGNFLPKPFSAFELASKVRGALDHALVVEEQPTKS